MHFRNSKKSSQDISLNETIDTDKDGNPLVFYHGTRQTFNKFKAKYDDARDIIKDISVWDNNGAYHKENNTLIECWLKEKKCNDWIYADTTDYFVEISCPKYDKYNLWFVRTKGSGWYSLDIQSGWQGGQLDITGEIYDDIIKYWKEKGYDISSYTNTNTKYK